MYLTGVYREDMPVMRTMKSRAPGPGQPWAADTGCFAHPERFQLDRYLTWLARQPLETCLFATAPDRFDDGPATLEVARPVLPLIRAAGAPAALVVQTGMTVEDVPWADVDVLFIGGPDRWQHSEACVRLAMEARRRGLPVHVGRVNGLRRLRWAASIGASSVDGTFLRYGKEANLPRLRAWLLELEARPPITWPTEDPAR